MEEWNWYKVLGAALTICGGVLALIGGLVLLFNIFDPLIALCVMVVIMLATGIILLRHGSNDSKD